ncbi:MAG: hypothetical protein DCF28_12445 [Alphaproteobacteria bacterium]|nr:MAG: hypothetical protein DCF28_12445 [Alphaproteobacteria bacterium]PZO36608.1 MAG: hypothetical protein DCE92_08810 [Alphaproteobacteria bacterium]
MFAILAAAVALSALDPIETDAPARYSLDLSIVRGGVTTVSTRSVVIEDGHAVVSFIDSEGAFEMNANLNPVQGDGDGDQLALAVRITNGDATPIEPNLVFDRGGTASVVIGNQDMTGQMIDGVTLALAPLSGTPATRLPWPVPTRP